MAIKKGYPVYITALHSILDIFQCNSMLEEKTANASFTFHSGYIPMCGLKSLRNMQTLLYIPFWIYSNTIDN